MKIFLFIIEFKVDFFKKTKEEYEKGDLIYWRTHYLGEFSSLEKEVFNKLCLDLKEDLEKVSKHFNYKHKYTLEIECVEKKYGDIKYLGQIEEIIKKNLSVKNLK